MIIVLNNPEIVVIIEQLFSRLNPDTPFDAAALTTTQRDAIGIFLSRSFEPMSKDIQTDELIDDLIAELEGVDEVVMDTLTETLDRMSIRAFTNRLMGFVAHITVSAGATSLLLHFRHTEDL